MQFLNFPQFFGNTEFLKFFMFSFTYASATCTEMFQNISHGSFRPGAFPWNLLFRIFCLVSSVWVPSLVKFLWGSLAWVSDASVWNFRFGKSIFHRAAVALSLSPGELSLRMTSLEAFPLENFGLGTVAVAFALTLSLKIRRFGTFALNPC